MLHAKFQDHRAFDSGEEYFKSFYHIWMWRHFGHVAKINFIN